MLANQVPKIHDDPYLSGPNRIGRRQAILEVILRVEGAQRRQRQTKEDVRPQGSAYFSGKKA